MNLYFVSGKNYWRRKNPQEGFGRVNGHLLIFCLMVLNTSLVMGQIETDEKAVSPVLVTNDVMNQQSVIKVKWLTDRLIYPEGVRVYRQQLGELTWIRMTETPIVKGGCEPSTVAYQADTTLRHYIELAKDLKPVDLKEMTKVFVLVKAVQSESFALYLGVQYHDVTVVQGATYRYKITNPTYKGEEIIGYSDFIKVEPYHADAAPAGIEITAKDKQVNINWQPDDLRFHGVNVYRRSTVDTLYRRINEVPLMIAQRELPNGKRSYPDVFFTDRDVLNKVKYTYRLAAIDFFGRESAMSDEIAVMPGDRTPPLEPYRLRKQVDRYDVRLSWINRLSPDQEGINIYRSYQYDDHYRKMNDQLLSVTDTVYHDRDLKAGYYYYIVAAVDSAGNEGRSSKMLAEVHDITPPAMPQNVVATADTGRIVLTWDANGEPDLAGYQIFRTVNSDRKDYYVLLNAEPLQQTTFTDTLPRNAGNYFLYKVAAVDSAMNRSEYSVPGKAKMPDVTPPVMPVLINAKAVGDYMVVEWIANREPDLAGYELLRFTDGVPDRIKINADLLAPSVTRFTDRTVMPDTLYSYVLQAIDSVGNRSPYSEPFVAQLAGNPGADGASEVLRFTVKKPLFGKSLHVEWRAGTVEGFMGYALFRRDSPDGEPIRVLNLTRDQAFDDRDKHKSSTQYQLRLYHNTGVVVKSQWISLK